MDKEFRNNYSLCIKSDFNQLNKVDSFLQDVIKIYCLSNSDYNIIFLCVSEAVSNAITHGNKNIKEKFVTIKVVIKNYEVTICVKDEGCGFEFDKVPSPITVKNIKKEQGRGLYIIKNYAKKLVFKGKGSIIEIKFDLSAGNSVLSGGHTVIGSKGRRN
jgi:serine/threonine-protein kinase RsbW